MKLVKTLGVAALAASALGGAAALGGTLFESPPRDAAEFAERVEAGSTHVDPNRRHLPAPKKRAKKAHAKAAQRRTAAERTYARTMNAWCVRQEQDVAQLNIYASDGLSSWLSLSRNWRARVAALRPPPRFRDEAARYLSTWERLEQITVRMTSANQRGDSVASLELYDRWVHTAAAQGDAAIAMGADRCAGPLLQGITPSS